MTSKHPSNPQSSGSQDSIDLDSLLEDIGLTFAVSRTDTWFDKAKADAKAALTALLGEAEVAGRIDELERAKNRKQIFGYYDDRISQLQQERKKL